VLDYLDAGALALTAASFPIPVPRDAGFMLITETDGSAAEAARLHAEVSEALADNLPSSHAPTAPGEIAALWRWRDGIANQVAAHRGGKVSDDIAVPPEQLAAAIAETVAIGARHELEALSWAMRGWHLHSTFLVDPRDAGELRRADDAAAELFAFAHRLWRQRQRRTRHRHRQARAARPPVGSAGSCPPRRRQTRVRPGRDPEPRQEAGRLARR